MWKKPTALRLAQGVVLSGLIAWTIAGFEPIKSAVQNWDEIGIGFSDLPEGLGLPFAALFGALAALASLGSAIAPLRTIALWVVVYAGLWAQGNLFLWDYGQFDGSPIDWNRHLLQGVAEVALWVSAVGFALWKPGWIAARALRLALLISALQAASLGGQLHRNAPFSEKLEAETHLIESVSLYSRKLNVIIVVLDSVQSDVFSEAMEDPTLRASASPGFTYYRDAVSLYTETNFSLQSILTSKPVPDRTNGARWIPDELKSSLPVVLTDRGFDSMLVAFATAAIDCSTASGGYQCVRASTLTEPGAFQANSAWREDVSEVFNLGLFRLAPHFLKPQIYDYGRWRIRRLYPVPIRPLLNQEIHRSSRRDLAIFDELIRSASVGDLPPRFRFYHFFAAHFPNTIDASCRFQRRVAGNSASRLRKNAVEASRCVLTRLYEFFQKLDEIGVYDRSLIFVVADHGQMFVSIDASVASPELPGRARSKHPGDGPLLVQPQRGVPLFMVKPMGARHELRVSDLPVSLCDVPSSVLDALDIEDEFGCESIFSPPHEERTPRTHYRYPYNSERVRLTRNWNWNEFSFQKFIVKGHSWYAESWLSVEPGSYDGAVWIEKEPVDEGRY